MVCLVSSPVTSLKQAFIQIIGAHLKMKFDKTSEQVIRFENFSGYFLARVFQYDEYTPNPIAEFMRSRYFSWQEEFRNEVSATVNNSDKIVIWNFHGLYDIKKLQQEDFEKISPADFTRQFSRFIQSEIGFDKKIDEAQKPIEQIS